MEENKKVFIGETGNKAEVTEEDRNAQSIEAVYGRNLVRQAGRLFKPDGAELIGAASVFYYSKAGLAGPVYMFCCQTDVSDVAEAHSDLGWKGLRDAFQKAYGRPAPKTRN